MHESQDSADDFATIISLIVIRAALECFELKCQSPATHGPTSSGSRTKRVEGQIFGEARTRSRQTRGQRFVSFDEGMTRV